MFLAYLRRHPYVVMLFFITLIPRLLDVCNIGELWDEYSVIKPGVSYYQNFANLDFSHESWLKNYEHPPVAKYIFTPFYIAERLLFGSLDKSFPEQQAFLAAKIASSFLGLGTVLILYLIAQNYVERKRAFLAAAIFALTPQIVGYNIIASLESVLLFFFVLFWYFCLKSSVVKQAISFALLSLTKYNGGFFIVMPLIINKIRYKNFNLKSYTRFLFIATVAVTILWPYLWSNPPLNLYQSIMKSSDPANLEFFLGIMQSPPVYYYILYFLATLAPYYVFSAIMFIILVLYKKINWRSYKELLILLLIPFLASFFPLKQDGVRYIILVYPTLAILSVIWLDKIKVNSGYLRYLAGIVLATFALNNYFIRPYYLDYFSPLVGGTSYVAEKKLFEVGWWGEGIKEAVLHVNKVALPGASVNIATTPRHVAPLLREDLQLEQNDFGQDYIIMNVSELWYNDPELSKNSYQLMHQVYAGGYPIVQIYERKIKHEK